MKEDLFDPIDDRRGIGTGLDAATLHRLRERRNQIAHEPETIATAPVSWDYLDGAIDRILSAVQVLELVHAIPGIAAFSKET